MSKIKIENVSFSYDKPLITVFEDINLEIDTAWKGIIYGKNGRGKTTFLNLIRKKLEPTKGNINTSVTFSFFPFEITNREDRVINVIKDALGPYRKYEKLIEAYLMRGDEDSLLLYGEVEEKYKAIDGYYIDSIIAEEFSKIYLNQDITERIYSSLSGGEKTKIKLIILFLQSGTFPLIDEPTNHLDIKAREECAAYLKTKKSGFLCVSHDKKFLESIGTHVISINRTRGIEINKINFENFIVNENKRLEKDKLKNIELKHSINRLNKSFAEKKSWSDNKESDKLFSPKAKVSADERLKKGDKGRIGAKAAKLMKRAKNIEKRISKNIDEKKELVNFIEKDYEIKFKENKKDKREILRVDNLNICYDDKKIINGLSFNISSGDRIAICGANGSGKSSIIKSLIGQKEYEGLIKFRENIKISYLAQEMESPSISLKEFLLNKNIDPKTFGAFLASFDFRGEILNKSMSDFSEGEKRKTALAISIYEEADIYIWDEPLNFLDIQLRSKVEGAILKYKPTIIFVEHDSSFISKVATDIIQL